MSMTTLTIEDIKSDNEIIKNLMDFRNVFWINKDKPSFEEADKHARFTHEDVKDAEDRLARFAPYIEKAFPETESTNGIIESKISEISDFKKELERIYDVTIDGSLLLKRDDTLPIAGTIKARGAIYEVLKHAETLALEEGILESKDVNYDIFSTDEFREFFSQYNITVGTTGNLGISVGIMGAKLGFEVIVHMSLEAKQWKKDLLRSHGVNVIEHDTDFTKAVENGRKESDANPKSYFVDDEHSIDLFLGYTVAGSRLKEQLDAKGIIVDEDNPLFLYLPCGIGGSPGGITFGLKHIYGDNVHCFFAEPSHIPSMLVGLETKKYDDVSVYDFEIDGKTNMDGLAVPRTSGFVSELMSAFFDGGYTLKEDQAKKVLTRLIDVEGIPLEPAAVAGLPGSAFLFKSEEGQKYLEEKGLTDKMKNATHIAWATGGSMVPKEDMDDFYNQGVDL